MDYKKPTTKLTLREYGRNIQGLVLKAKAVEDRHIRTKMIQDLVRHMQILFPATKDAVDHKKKLWETVYRIADYDLDVDCPYDIQRPVPINGCTAKVEYPKSKAKIKHYGSIIDSLIDRACRMEPSPERQRLILIIANMMKMFNQQFAGGVASDEIIFEHIKQLSKGQIVINSEETTLKNILQNPTQRNGNQQKYYNPPRKNNSKKDNKHRSKGRSNNTKKGHH